MNDEVIDRAFRAVEQNDVATLASIYADDIMIWHAHDGLVKSKAPNIATLAGLHVLGTPRYTVLERIHSGSKVAQRHRLVITSRDGKAEYTVEAAIFFTIVGGQITEFREYMDSRQLGVIGAAIAQAMQDAAHAP